MARIPTKAGVRTITLKADVTYTSGDFLNSPTVFMSETGKKRFLRGVEVFRHLNGLPSDAEAVYRIVQIPSPNTVRISLRIGGEGVIAEDVTLKQFREGWFGQDHHPWLFCDSWEAYEAGQEPDYLNGGYKPPKEVETKVAISVGSLESSNPITSAASKYSDSWN